MNRRENYRTEIFRSISRIRNALGVVLRFELLQLPSAAECCLKIFSFPRQPYAATESVGFGRLEAKHGVECFVRLALIEQKRGQKQEHRRRRMPAQIGKMEKPWPRF